MGVLDRILRRRSQNPPNNPSANDGATSPAHTNIPSSAAEVAIPSSVPQDKFAFLQELTSQQRHSGKTFYQHLLNVYTALKDAGASPEVCDAGLFHSIYGTEFYSFQSNRITRDVVRGMIGEYAEGLVYVFCTSKERFRVIVENMLGLGKREQLDLCRIEIANLGDQNPRGKLDEKIRVLEMTMRSLEGEV